MQASALDRIREVLAWAGGEGEPAAVGWATVELDRAAIELARELGVVPEVFVQAPDSAALGASSRIAPGILPGGLSLAILEPSTEGRLAYTLARVGEGPVAIWSALEGAIAPSDPGTRPGPFGFEQLVSGGPVHGPHRFLIGTAPGTIRP
ncbi:MAG: hypothetical protein ABI562_01240 [Chloroflexota bacterium]